MSQVAGHEYVKHERRCQCGWRPDPRSPQHQETQFRVHLNTVVEQQRELHVPRYVATGGGHIFDQDEQRFLEVSDIERLLNAADEDAEPDYGVAPPSVQREAAKQMAEKLDREIMRDAEQWKEGR
jgi:hypothetical protein